MSQSSSKPVAEIALYGVRRTGAGWIVRLADGRMFGDGEPRERVSFTEAVFVAVDAIRAAGIERGIVRVYDSGGDRMSEFSLEARVPYYSDLAWTAAPIYTISVDVLTAAATIEA